MRLFQKVLSTGKIAARIKLIFNKAMGTFYIALVRLSSDGYRFMRRSEGKLNNFSKQCFFEAVPRCDKFSAVIGLNSYFGWTDTISL